MAFAIATPLYGKCHETFFYYFHHCFYDLWWLFVSIHPSLFRGQKWFPKCLNGGFRGVFVLRSGLWILIWAPEVPFLVPPKTPKMGVFGTSSARIKILRPLFNSNTPPKTHIWEPFWTPEKWFLAILFILVIFPLKLPLKPKKSTEMGGKGRRAKTKTVLKPVNQVAKLGSMQNLIS